MTDGTIKILYVQPGLDSRSAAEVLEKTLKFGIPSITFCVVVTSNAFKAVEYCEDISFDVFFLHRDLPSLSAVELMRIFRMAGNKKPIFLLQEPVDEQTKAISARDLSNFAGTILLPYSVEVICQSLRSVLHCATSTSTHSPASSAAVQYDMDEERVVLEGTVEPMMMDAPELDAMVCEILLAHEEQFASVGAPVMEMTRSKRQKL